MITNLCAIQGYVYGIIAAVVVVLIIIIAVAVHKRKHRNPDEKVIESRADVNANVQAIEPLLIYAEGKPEMLSQLKLLQDKIKYLTPSDKKEVASIDEKIYNALGDAKIELSKTKGDTKSGKAQKYIDQVELLIAERAAYTER